MSSGAALLWRCAWSPARNSLAATACSSPRAGSSPRRAGDAPWGRAMSESCRPRHVRSHSAPTGTCRRWGRVACARAGCDPARARAAAHGGVRRAALAGRAGAGSWASAAPTDMTRAVPGGGACRTVRAARGRRSRSGAPYAAATGRVRRPPARTPAASTYNSTPPPCRSAAVAANTPRQQGEARYRGVGLLRRICGVYTPAAPRSARAGPARGDRPLQRARAFRARGAGANHPPRRPRIMPRRPEPARRSEPACEAAAAIRALIRARAAPAAPP
jgi:hypothetical protein